MSNLNDQVLAAKRRLRESREELKARHDEGLSGPQVAQALADLTDELVCELYQKNIQQAGLGDRDWLLANTALVPHGGQGRRGSSPYSDVDLMLLTRDSDAPAVRQLASGLFRDLGDLGLAIGNSVRTPEQAIDLSIRDAITVTSLMEGRWLAGDEKLFQDFQQRFGKSVWARSGRLLGLIESSRAEERSRHGESIYVLEPHIKRSRGGLRDLHLLRWIGYLRCRTAEPADLVRLGHLTDEDLIALTEAEAFLLRVRNEMHFHHGRAFDFLDRGEQWRIAEAWKVPRTGSLLPVETFMGEYFRHSRSVDHLVNHFIDGVRPGVWRRQLAMFVLGHRVDHKFFVGPLEVRVDPAHIDEISGSLSGVLRLALMAALHDKAINYHSAEAIRRNAPHLSDELSPESARYFLQMLQYPTKLAHVLRQLHDMRIFEKVIPEYARLRGLLQFNASHQYTVDEHSLLTVEVATKFRRDSGEIGRLYRSLAQPWILHLALLLHDAGKGFEEDHSIVGGRIARVVCERLGLSQEDSETIVFLVEQHLALSHMAFRRDTHDEQLIVRFAVEVGSPERLKLLYLLTVADMSSVAPHTWNRWKADVLREVYERVLAHLSGDRDPLDSDADLQRLRKDLARRLKSSTDVSVLQLIESLPPLYLHSSSIDRIEQELQVLSQLGPKDVFAHGWVEAGVGTVRYMVATNERVMPRIFHRLAGVLSSKGQEILEADIHTLPGGLVVDRFRVRDTDHPDGPDRDRIEQISRALVDGVQSDKLPPLGQARRYGRPGRQDMITTLPTKVNIDNTTSARSTIIDVFAPDRPGLLFAIARTLVDLNLSISLARIGTYMDQAVDVFYVNDDSGEKITNADRLRHIQQHLLERVTAFGKQSLQDWAASSDPNSLEPSHSG